MCEVWEEQWSDAVDLWFIVCHSSSRCCFTTGDCSSYCSTGMLITGSFRIWALFMLQLFFEHRECWSLGNWLVEKYRDLVSKQVVQWTWDHIAGNQNLQLTMLSRFHKAKATKWKLVFETTDLYVTLEQVSNCCCVTHIDILLCHYVVESSDDGYIGHQLHAGAVQWSHKGTLSYAAVATYICNWLGYLSVGLDFQHLLGWYL